MHSSGNERNRPRVVLLTGPDLRHEYAALQLLSRLELLSYIVEERQSISDFAAGMSDDDQGLIHDHFHERNLSEERYFKSIVDKGASAVASLKRVVPRGGMNSNETIEFITGLKPDLLLVFGAGILKRPLITCFPNRILNIHLGLSPYYRGSGTNVWPLVNREPEYVGATIHYLDEGIDTGPIVAHCRPDIAPEDRLHDLGNKTIIKGIDILIQAALSLHVKGRLGSVPQRGKGKYYERKDFNAEAIREMNRQFLSGMIPEYLSRKETLHISLRELADD